MKTIHRTKKASRKKTRSHATGRLLKAAQDPEAVTKGTRKKGAAKSLAPPTRGYGASLKAKLMVKPRSKRRPALKLRSKPTTEQKSLRTNSAREFTFIGGVERHIERSDRLTKRVAALAEDVRITIALPSVSGEALQRHREPLNFATIGQFSPRPDAREIAIERLKALGYTILRRGRFTVSVSAPARLVRETCKTKLLLQARPHPVSARSTISFAANYEAPQPADLFVAPETSLSLPSQVGDMIDHFVFVPPPISFAPSTTSPSRGFHGVDTADIRRLLRVPSDATGAGVVVAVVDTGFYPHPYYAAQGFNFKPVPTASAPKPERDPAGHGTAIATNVFATAPGAQVLGFKQTINPQDAVEDAADAGADIITCSWGWPNEQVFNTLQAPLLQIIAEGKIVVFASGNGHYAWPGSQPEVLSVGGVFWNATGDLEASNYASGFISNRFNPRRVPDVCGLCGQLPKAAYIMMPTQPGSTLDKTQSGPTFPDGDLTAANDGWAGASGTSSAAPQVAGVVALMLERARARGTELDQEGVRALLERSAIEVTGGTNGMRTAPVGRPNPAVGWGLVDATAALALI